MAIECRHKTKNNKGCDDFFANVTPLPPWADIRQIVQGSDPNIAQVSAWDKFDPSRRIAGDRHRVNPLQAAQWQNFPRLIVDQFAFQPSGERLTQPKPLSPAPRPSSCQRFQLMVTLSAPVFPVTGPSGYASSIFHSRGCRRRSKFTDWRRWRQAVPPLRIDRRVISRCFASCPATRFGPFLADSWRLRVVWALLRVSSNRSS